MHPTPRTIHTQAALTFTAALLAAGSLAACASGSTAELGVTGSAAPTISASATPSATPTATPTLSPELAKLREEALSMTEPEKPEQLAENTAEGVAALGAYLVDLYRYSLLTGETRALEDISDPRCIFCSDLASKASSQDLSEEWTEPWEQKVTLIEVFPQASDSHFIAVHVSFSMTEIVSRDASGNVVDTIPAAPETTLVLATYFNGEHWMIRGAETLDQ